VGGGRCGSSCHSDMAVVVVVGIDGRDGQSHFAMLSWIWHLMAARSMGALFGGSGAGDSEGGGMGGSGCHGSRAVVVVTIG